MFTEPELDDEGYDVGLMAISDTDEVILYSSSSSIAHAQEHNGYVPSAMRNELINDHLELLRNHEALQKILTQYMSENQELVA